MSLFRNVYYDRDLERDAKNDRKIAAIKAQRAHILTRLLDQQSIDTEALDKLMEEKRARAEAEADESAADLAENSRIAAAVEELSRHEKAAKIALQRETAAEVEAQIASQHLRDTADLNDKHRLQRQGLTRNGDDDPRLGPASAQVFAGEDLFASERRKLQHTQMQAWTAQQMAEKSARAAAEKAVDKAYAAAVTAACGTVDSLQSGTAALVKARTLGASAANLKLMNERRAAKANAWAEDKAMDDVSNSTMRTRGAGMGLLSEDMADGMSAADPRRYRPDYYRGRPASEAVATLASYEAQTEEKAMRKAIEAEEEARRVAAMRAALMAAGRKERELAGAAREGKVAARAALDKQVAEAQATRAAGKASDRTPAFGPAYFEAFGKSLF